MLYIRNLENTERPIYSVKAHSQIVNAIDGVGGLGIGEGAPEIVTGSRDGKLHDFVQTALETCSAFYIFSCSEPHKGRVSRFGACA